jgi:hypothetical protein
MVERQVVALDTPVQLRSITPSERADDGESGAGCNPVAFAQGVRIPSLALCPRGAAWIAHQNPDLGVAGSNPVAGTHGLGEFQVELPACKAGS